MPCKLGLIQWQCHNNAVVKTKIVAILCYHTQQSAITKLNREHILCHMHQDDVKLSLQTHTHIFT